MKLSTIAPTLMLSGIIALSTTGCDSKEEREKKYLERAREQIEQGDLVKARLEVRNALQINNQSAEAFYVRAQILEEDALLREMMAALDAAVAADPTYLPAQMKRVYVYFAFGPAGANFTKATLDKILEIDPNNAEAITLQGRVALRDGDVEGAIAFAELALAKDSKSIYPYVLLGEIYKDDPEQALAYVEQGLQANPGSAELIQTRIRVLSAQGDIEAALAEYERLTAAEPDNLDYAREKVAYLAQNGQQAAAEQFLLSQIQNRPGVSDYKVWLIQILLESNEQQRAIETAEGFISGTSTDPELHYLLSEVHMQLRQPEEAISTLQKLLEILPTDSAEANNTNIRIAEISAKSGDTETAGRYIDDILATDAENPDALILSGELLIRAGDYEGAVIQLRNALRREPDSFRARMALAQAHELTGSIDLALDSYQSALEIDPANTRLALKIAGLYYQREDSQAGDRLLQRYLATEQTAALVAPALMESYARQDNWVLAAETVETLKTQDANVSLALYLEGGLYFEQEDYDRAIEIFENLLEREQGSARVLSAIARSLVAKSGTDAAVNYLEAYAAKHPNELAPLELQAGLFADGGDLAKAVSLYEKALSIQPENINLHLAISRLQQAAGNTEASEQSIDKAIELAPDDPSLKILKAGLQESRGNYEQAAQLYVQVLEKNPSNVIAANNLAMILVDHLPSDDNTARAKAVTSEFHKAAEPVFLDTRAWVLYKAGDYEQARSLLERAMADEEKVIPVYRYHLGMVYAKLGENTAAVEQLEAALGSGDEFLGIDEARAALDGLSTN